MSLRCWLGWHAVDPVDWYAGLPEHRPRTRCPRCGRTLNMALPQDEGHAGPRAATSEEQHA